MDDTHIIYFDRTITFMFTQKNPKALTGALLAGSQHTGPPWTAGSVQGKYWHTFKKKEKPQSNFTSFLVNKENTSFLYFPFYYC